MHSQKSTKAGNPQKFLYRSGHAPLKALKELVKGFRKPRAWISLFFLMMAVPLCMY